MFNTPSTKSGIQVAGSHATPEARQVTSAADARHNHILATLPDEELSRWLPDLELIDLPLGYVLYEAGEKDDFVYLRADISRNKGIRWRRTKSSSD